jgi:hypothetical protein
MADIAIDSDIDAEYNKNMTTDVIRKREAKWQTIFNKYLRETKFYGFFELKQTEAETFPFAKIETVQWEGLVACEKSGLVWKLSDEDQRQKPCDCLSVVPMNSYLVVKFRDGFYVVRFQKIVDLRDNGVISISRTDMGKIADKIIRLS